MLRRTPRMWFAFREGEVWIPNARIAAELALSLPQSALADFEFAALDRATTLAPGRFKAFAQAARERVQLESFVERHASSRDDRRVWVEPDYDGMSLLALNLSAEYAQRAHVNADTTARHLVTQAGETRTLAQLRADVARDLLGGVLLAKRSNGPGWCRVGCCDGSRAHPAWRERARHSERSLAHRCRNSPQTGCRRTLVHPAVDAPGLERRPRPRPYRVSTASRPQTVGWHSRLSVRLSSVRSPREELRPRSPDFARRWRCNQRVKPARTLARPSPCETRVEVGPRTPSKWNGQLNRPDRLHACGRSAAVLAIPAMLLRNRHPLNSVQRGGEGGQNDCTSRAAVL